MSAFNLAGVLAHHADRYPDRPCLVWGARVITYAELDERAARTAGGLAKLGIGRGDVVAVVLYNCPEFLELVFAVARLGAVFMPVNWRLAADEVAYIVEHANARMIVSEPELVPVTAAAQLRQPALLLVGVSGAPPGWRGFGTLAGASPAPLETVEGDDLLRLMYTSGTTARPKGVMITHANLYWKNIAHMVEFNVTGDDRALACGPLYHVGALDLGTTTVLYAGGTVEIHRKFEAEPVLDALERRGIGTVWLAPAMVNQLLAHPSLEQRDLSRVRLIIDGGGEDAVAAHRAAAARVPERVVRRRVRAHRDRLGRHVPRQAQDPGQDRLGGQALPARRGGDLG